MHEAWGWHPTPRSVPLIEFAGFNGWVRHTFGHFFLQGGPEELGVHLIVLPVARPHERVSLSEKIRLSLWRCCVLWEPDVGVLELAHYLETGDESLNKHPISPPHQNDEDGEKAQAHPSTSTLHLGALACAQRAVQGFATVAEFSEGATDTLPVCAEVVSVCHQLLSGEPVVCVRGDACGPRICSGARHLEAGHEVFVLAHAKADHGLDGMARMDGAALDPPPGCSGPPGASGCWGGVGGVCMLGIRCVKPLRCSLTCL